MLKRAGIKNLPAYSFYAWLTYYKMQAQSIKSWLKINPVKGFLSFVMLSFLCEYSLISTFILNDLVFSELLPAYCANILSPGLLDSSHFTAIESIIKSRADLIDSYVELAENQYSSNFTASDASCFCYNLHELLYQVLSQSSIIELIRLQWEICVIPFFAPALDLLGAFDNSPKIEYSGLSYSEFIVRGVANTLVVIRNKGNPGDLPVYELNIAINFLRNTIHKIWI